MTILTIYLKKSMMNLLKNQGQQTRASRSLKLPKMKMIS